MIRVLWGFLTIALVVLDVRAALKVSVYYESLCPDSVSFLTTQLYPNYKFIANFINLELIPYGKAEHKQLNGKWNFECQHGAAECQGNIFQSCVLSMNYADVVNVEFVNCVMNQPYPFPSYLTTIENCARMSSLDVEKIKNCSLSFEGERLLALNGDKTRNLKPKLDFVPTIVYDDKFDQNAQTQSLTDFLGVVCSKIIGPKPTVCVRFPLAPCQWWIIPGSYTCDCCC